MRPSERQKVAGVVKISATATIPDFQFSKLEYAAGHTPLDSGFASIGDVPRTQATDTVLGTWFVGNLPRGPYTLRLTAVDNEGQFPRPCDVHIYVDP